MFCLSVHFVIAYVSYNNIHYNYNLYILLHQRDKIGKNEQVGGIKA